MNLKKITKIGIFIIMIFCFITHFLYQIFPSFITSIFFPVNESIWEHMKMIVSSILIWQFVLYFILKKYNINHNNFYLNIFVMCLSSVILFLIIYYPLYLVFGENFILNIICLFITILISSFLGYKILTINNIKNSDIIGIIGIILVYIIFGILTYFPLKNNLFIDPQNNKYGIAIYKI